MKSNENIVVIGGGTGSFTVLKALRKHTKNLTAIVSMADDGGSTGVLRDELGVLPPGDVRQCLVALSRYPKARNLFNYRFEEGTFGGHSFGNLLLTALEKTTGSFAEAVETASEILRVDGRVIPATLDNVRLKMIWDDASVTLNGEHEIDVDTFKHDPRTARLELVPKATANPHAIEAIRAADKIVIAPGDLYTSLGPLLIIEAFSTALAETKAEKLYVCNLVTKHGQTDGFSVADHVGELERFAGRSFIDVVLYNSQKPDAEALEAYAEEGAYLVDYTETESGDSHMKSRAVAQDLLGGHEGKLSSAFGVPRALIRHDIQKLGNAIIAL